MIVHSICTEKPHRTCRGRWIGFDYDYELPMMCTNIQIEPKPIRPVEYINFINYIPGSKIHLKPLTEPKSLNSLNPGAPADLLQGHTIEIASLGRIYSYSLGFCLLYIRSCLLASSSLSLGLTLSPSGLYALYVQISDISYSYHPI